MCLKLRGLLRRRRTTRAFGKNSEPLAKNLEVLGDNRHSDKKEKEKIILEIETILKEAREILQNANFFMGQTEETTIPNFTMEDVKSLRQASLLVKENQRNTNLGLVVGSSLGIYSSATTIAGLAVGITGTFALTGGGAAVVSGITTIASMISRSQHQEATTNRISSIVEKFYRLINNFTIIMQISYLSPWENAIEKDLKKEDISMSTLRDVKTKATKLLSVLSDMNKSYEDKDLDYILQKFDEASSRLNNIILQLSIDGADNFTLITSTAHWLLNVYRNASPQYKSLLQFSSKIAYETPDIINGLAKIKILSENYSNILGSITAPLLIGNTVCETIGKEVTEEIVSTTTNQAVKKAGEKIREEAAEQTTVVVGGAGKKVGEEVAEGAASSSKLLSVNQVKLIRAGVAGAAVASMVVDAITLTNAVQNLREGSPTKFAELLETLADFLTLIVVQE